MRASDKPMHLVARRYTRTLLLLAILISTVACDRITKAIASKHLRQSDRISLLGDTIRVQYIENPGAFLGLGSSLPRQQRFWLFIVLNTILLAAVFGLLMVEWKMDRTRFIALALLLSGGVGNMVDRLLRNGLVIDFLNLGIGSVRTGIFNVADVAITAGALLLFVRFLQEAGMKKQLPSL